MAWLFLGLISLPLTGLVYLAAQWLGPRLLEPVPECAPAFPTHERGNRLRLGKRQQAVVRGGAAVLVLALVAVGVGRWPKATAPASPATPTSAEVQLPAPISLKVQTRVGAYGSGPAQLHDPRDVAVDPSGDVYVADTGNKRIVKFKADGSSAAAWSGPFGEPSSLAVVKDGLIVDDSETGQLHKLNFEGKLAPGFEHDLGLSHPRGIAASPNGIIYAGDTANNRILKIAPDGAPAGVFDTKGTKLEQPTGVAVDPQGNLYSIEPVANRIQKFAPDGTLQAHLYLPGAVTPLPPRAIWIPGSGLTVSLPEQNELLTYGPAGVPEATFVPEAPAPLRPLGLALAPDGHSVWVIWNNSAVATLLLWP